MPLHSSVSAHSESRLLPGAPQAEGAGADGWVLPPQMLQSGGMRSQSPRSRELQQQGCAAVPRDQFLQLQQQLLQAERRGQHLQEELESRPSGTNMQQVRPSSKVNIFKVFGLVVSGFFFFLPRRSVLCLCQFKN